MITFEHGRGSTAPALLGILDGAEAVAQQVRTMATS